MHTIKWVNDTFCPWGLTPIEDLPEAIPGQGNSCVIAKVLKDGFAELENVHVGSTSIDFNIFDGDLEDIQDARLKEMLELDESIYLPQDVRMFIRDFDCGKFPELIDDEGTIDTVGEWDAHDTFKIGCTKDETCSLCFPNQDIPV